MGGIIIEETIEISTDDPCYEDFINTVFEQAAIADDTMVSLFICFIVNAQLRARVSSLEAEIARWSDIVLEDQKVHRRKGIR